MTWRIFGVFLMVTGIVLFVVGVWVEFELQAQVGRGLWAFLAWMFRSGDIESWKRTSLELMIAGPIIYIVGHLLFHVTRARRRE